MSEQLRFSSEIDLAKAVVKSSGTERREMLKRFYVDKHPVLSGLSSFTCTAHGEKSKVDNGKQDFKRAKRSLERTQADESSETSKQSKRNVKKHRTKVKVVEKDGIYEESLEKHESRRRQAGSGEKMCCSATGLQNKQVASVKNNTSVVESQDPLNDPANNEEKEDDSSVRTRNCRTEPKDRHRNQRNQLQQQEENWSSTVSGSNKDNAAEIEGSCLDNTSDLSESILDEFLSSSSRRGGRKRENVSKNGEEVKASDQRQEKLLVIVDRKETVKLKTKPTSVLDDFI